MNLYQKDKYKSHTNIPKKLLGVGITIVGASGLGYLGFGWTGLLATVFLVLTIAGLVIIAEPRI